MNPGVDWLERACFVYETQGRLLPSLWAQNGPRKAVALPLGEDPNDTPLLKSVLLGILAQTVEAIEVGTVAEVWVREFDSEADVAHIRPGDLAAMAEVDPSIRTALICTWGDAIIGEVCSEMAKVVITDDGEIEWDITHSSEPFGPIAAMVKAVVNHEGLPVENAEQVLASVAESMGWQVLTWDE